MDSDGECYEPMEVMSRVFTLNELLRRWYACKQGVETAAPLLRSNPGRYERLMLYRVMVMTIYEARLAEFEGEAWIPAELEAWFAAREQACWPLGQTMPQSLAEDPDWSYELERLRQAELELCELILGLIELQQLPSHIAAVAKRRLAA